MKVSGKVIIDDHWRSMRGEMNREIRRSLGQAAGVAVAAGRAKPSRYNTARIQSDIDVSPVVPTLKGQTIEIRWKDWRANFFDKGTYAKLGAAARLLEGGYRRGAGKKGRYQYTKVGNRGVKPIMFTAAARRAGRAALVTALRRNLR